MIGAAAGATIAIAAVALVSARRPVQERPLIVVLPFEDPGQHAVLRDALLEETIGQLSGIQPARLGVIARTSAMRFEGKRAGIAEIAAALRAEYVVEGSIRASGSGARISARLIQARDQAEVWSAVLEDASEETLERDAPARIAAGVLQTLFPSAAAPKRSIAGCGAGADAYRNGRYLQAKGETSRAVEYFEQAGNCADADAARAEALIALARSGRLPLREGYDRAGEAAKRALAAEPDHAEALAALANVEFWNLWRFAEAEAHFRRALAINPSSAAAYHDYAWLLVVTGRAAEAVDTLRRALALDPLSPRVNIDAGWLFLQAHRFEEAAAQARRAQELEPSMREARFCAARAQALAKGVAPEVLRGDDPFYEAMRFAGAGDREHAFEALDAAVRERRVMVVTLKSEPAFEKLHGDARFAGLVAKVGLP
jgi:TolB-like protein/Flp pilus assembly protein TadD